MSNWVLMAYRKTMVVSSTVSVSLLNCIPENKRSDEAVLAKMAKGREKRKRKSG